MTAGAISRRQALVGIAGIGAAFSVGVPALSREEVSLSDRQLREGLAALEARGRARLGFAVLDTRGNEMVGHRLDTRFTMCSTFKLSLAALLLQRMDAGIIRQDIHLAIDKGDLVGNSPAVRIALDRGERNLSALVLAEAAQKQSDNAAANILLRLLGGPSELTRFWRSLGDRVSRLDRYEPALNTSHDGDLRDTTTPAAMAHSVMQLVTGHSLSSASRERLTQWLLETQTGLRRLRAGLPESWRVGDKTGTMTGARYADKVNDVAIVWHPNRTEPFVLAAFLEAAGSSSEGARPEDEAMLAEAARLAASWIGSRVR